MIINEGRPGKKLPALTNPGVAGDLLTGKQLIGADGQIITGTMASVVQATPSISVSTNGLITASATQSAGRVAAGTKSATKQLTTQAGKTVTPGRTKQTAVASGRYTTGTVYVAGDSDLLAANIKKGVNIFGVAGTYEGRIITCLQDWTQNSLTRSTLTLEHTDGLPSGAEILAFIIYDRITDVTDIVRDDDEYFMLTFIKRNGFFECYGARAYRDSRYNGVSGQFVPYFDFTQDSNKQVTINVAISQDSNRFVQNGDYNGVCYYLL